MGSHSFLSTGHFLPSFPCLLLWGRFSLWVLSLGRGPSRLWQFFKEWPQLHCGHQWFQVQPLCVQSPLLWSEKQKPGGDMVLRSILLGSLSSVGSWAWPREQHSIHEQACVHLTPFNGAVRYSTPKRFVIGHPVSTIGSHLFHLLLMGDKGIIIVSVETPSLGQPPQSQTPHQRMYPAYGKGLPSQCTWTPRF